MYSDKKNVLQLAALLKEHEIRNVVLCPGSRNIPIVQTLARHPFFTCHAVTDERNAGFFAIGLALNSGKPAAICCTSGTALLNIHPAVAEAYYQQVPLVVISADRPAAWIGQMDGQTLPQDGVFRGLVKCSVSLPEIHTREEEWHCNRLVNEALLAVNHHGKGPVHINVPMSEPLFSFTAEQLPEVRVIQRYNGLNIYEREYGSLIARLGKYTKRMMVAGQQTLIYQFERKTAKLVYKHFTWLCEHMANQTVPGIPVKNFDALLASLDESQLEKLVPDIVVTYGGHIVSKRLKQWLRNHPPKEHWHVASDGEVRDTFGVLTTVIEMDPFEFIEKVAVLMDSNVGQEYPKQWESLSKKMPEPQFGYSAMAAVGALLHALPANSTLHLANSSAVRYAQMFKLPNDTEVCCNRGTSGIEGSLSTALGYAWVSDRLNFILLGDLSFFYNMNALWDNGSRGNVRILLLNNGGGEIFGSLQGAQLESPVEKYVKGSHRMSARSWAEANQFDYAAVHDMEELEAALPAFVQADQQANPQFMEVFTQPGEDIRLLNSYYNGLK